MESVFLKFTSILLFRCLRPSVSFVRYRFRFTITVSHGSYWMKSFRMNVFHSKFMKLVGSDSLIFLIQLSRALGERKTKRCQIKNLRTLIFFEVNNDL